MNPWQFIGSAVIVFAAAVSIGANWATLLFSGAVIRADGGQGIQVPSAEES